LISVSSVFIPLFKHSFQETVTRSSSKRTLCSNPIQFKMKSFTITLLMGLVSAIAIPQIANTHTATSLLGLDGIAPTLEKAGKIPGAISELSTGGLGNQVGDTAAQAVNILALPGLPDLPIPDLPVPDLPIPDLPGL
jgi:hypothetical protein